VAERVSAFKPLDVCWTSNDFSCDATIGDVTVERVHRSVTVAGQRAPAFRVPDPRMLALFLALVVFRLLPEGFTARELRQHVAPLLGKAPSVRSTPTAHWDPEGLFRLWPRKTSC
jgi:hypothetical protein